MSSAPSSAAWITNLRHRRQLSLRDLARLTGIPKSSLCDLEHGRRQITHEESRRLDAVLGSLTLADDRIVGVACYPATPKYESVLIERLAESIECADRTVVVYPSIHPWLLGTRTVREAVSHHGLPTVDRVVEEALRLAARPRGLVFPVGAGLMNRLLARDAEFARLSQSSLRKQLAHFIDIVLDDSAARTPLVDDNWLSLFFAGQSGVRTPVVVDGSTVVRVLGNNSVQWIDADASDEARQRVEAISTAVDRLIATAKGNDGSSTVYSVYSRLFEQSRPGVSR
jgi:transcriptional regulator with XRE-family HTH domain